MDVVDAATVINVHSDPGAGDRFSRMVLLIENVAAKNALLDLVKLQLRKIRFDLERASDFFQRTFGDLCWAFPACFRLDIVNPVRNFGLFVSFDFGREAFHFCHHKVSLLNKVKT